MDGGKGIFSKYELCSTEIVAGTTLILGAVSRTIGRGLIARFFCMVGVELPARR
jgi:hypothetical protein